jgi:hypothetical protein
VRERLCKQGGRIAVGSLCTVPSSGFGCCMGFEGDLGWRQEDWRCSRFLAAASASNQKEAFEHL